MKKKLSLFFVSALLLTGVGQVAKAQEVDTGTSEASIEFSQGELSLVQVNPIYFGSHTIGASTDNTYTSIGSQTATVADFRGLADGEWYLNASISGFTDDDTNQTLPGFGLQFNAGDAEADNVSNSLSGPDVSTPNLTYVASDEGSTSFLTATAGNGRGSWTGTWSEVELTIPEGSETVGNHTATITWVLLDAPQ